MKAFSKSVIATRRMTEASKKILPPSKPQHEAETHFEIEVEEEEEEAAEVQAEPHVAPSVRIDDDQGRLTL